MPKSLLATLALVLLAGCVTRSPASQDWVALETPHFDILSALSADATRALGRDLELFRASVEHLAGVPLPAPARVLVFAFDDRGLDRPFNRRDVPAPAFESGYLLESLARPTIVLRNGGGWQDAPIAMRHDYSHYLLRNRGGLDRPAWYDEGMAWLAATTEVDAPRAVLGQLAEPQMRVLETSAWIPLEEILEAEFVSDWSAARRKAFGAEAWAFVHDLHFFRALPGDVGGRLHEILTGGIEEWGELRRSLEPLDARNERLELFRFRKRWEGIELDNASAAPLAAPRAVDRAEARTQLGWLALGLDRRTLAERHFKSALRERPGEARALAGLVTIATRRGKLAEARSALEAGDASAHAAICLAGARLEIAESREADAAEARAQHAEMARTRLDSCMDRGAAPSEVHALYAETYLVDGQPALAAVAPLDRAQQELPSSLRIQLLRAQQRRHEGREGTARVLARVVLSRSHDETLRDAAREIVEAR